MSGQADDRVGIGRLKEIRTRRPPWQLLMVGNTDGPISFSAETNNALTRIFELLPHLGGVTIRTTSGDLNVSRDFAGNYVKEVDELLASILTSEPEITGIVFPATGTRPEHVATSEDPHLLPEGKELAATSRAEEVR
ncbi:hypothetical protein [Sinorhizobium sp. CCBAU 05631]|uniref:hypothetical protein n=1 Tax=Sinorhizobium sp. CCBAU 05631 TaxID=794846 RepID=UPI0004B36CEA|nr:hypothetical protein [Sinorhizobium sp. CCBAU 05631]